MMILDRLTLHNFNSFKGRQELELRPASKDKPVILVGGLNGSGKTSIIDALLLAIYGKHANVSSRNGSGYTEYLSECITHSVPKETGAGVELVFRHTMEGRETIYALNRCWYVENGTLKERFEVVKDGCLDALLSESWDQWIEDILPKRLANLFFFDGEKIVDLADTQKSASILNASLHALLGLDLIDRLLEDLQILERRKKAALKPMEDRRKIEEFEGRIAELRTKEQELRYKQASSQNDLEQIEKSLDKLKQQYKEKGGEFHEQREKLEMEFKGLSAKIDQTEHELRQLASQSLPLLLLSDMLASVAKQASFEETRKGNRLMMDTLESRDAVVLKQLADLGVSLDSLDIVAKWLMKDRQGRSSGGDHDQYLEMGEDFLSEILQLEKNELPEQGKKAVGLMDQWKNLSSARDELERKVNAVPDAEDIAPLAASIAEKNKELDAIKKILSGYEDDLRSLHRDIEFQERNYQRELSKKLDNEFQVEDITRMLAHSEKGRRTLHSFRDEVLKSHLARLSNLILECYRLLSRKREFFEKLIIDHGDYTISLLKKDGRQIPMEKLSAGERQILALSLLWGLALATGRPIPTIIDTPLGRLDSKHRSKLVERYFPVAAHQVILLSTDEEISGCYYDSLKESVSRSYLLQYSDDEHATFVHQGYFQEGERHGN